MGIYNDLMFTEALAQVEALVTSKNSDEIADRIELIAANSNLAMPCLMLLVMKVKGVDTTKMNGVELANTRPTIADLILPPGVIL